MRDRRDPPFQGRLRPKPFNRAAGLVRNHIKPTLGPVKLKDLSPANLRGMYRAKLDSGLSGRTVAYVHVTLYSALEQAVADGLIWWLPIVSGCCALSGVKVMSAPLSVPCQAEISELLEELYYDGLR